MADFLYQLERNNFALKYFYSADLYFEIGFHIWDYSGPSLIVEEAGGVVLDISGKPVSNTAVCLKKGSHNKKVIS